MVFNAAQFDAFFTSANYLSLSAWTAGAFAVEGIVKPEDLGKFDKDGLDVIFCNLCKPPRALLLVLSSSCSPRRRWSGWWV